MKLQHFKELDGIRAIAALMVMFFHFFWKIETNIPVLILIKKLSFIGQTGVSLFFVLSGFLITRILLNSKNTKGFFLNFYVRRALRIFPLYYLFLILFYFILPLIDKSDLIPFGQQIYFWVYLQNFAMTFNWNWNGPQHFWSLAVEEHFYLFWPFLIFYLDKNKIRLAIYLIIIIAFILRLVFVLNKIDVFVFTFTRMDELAIGALLAIWELNGKLESGQSRKYLIIFVFAFIPTIALWILTSGSGFEIIQIIKYVLLAVCYFCFIGFAITIKDNHWLKKALKFNFLSYTGKISYGLYVYHPICFLLVNKYGKIDSIILSLILSFACCYMVASLSYYFFESKFLIFKNKFQYN